MNKIPDKIIKDYNLYPFNKNLSVFIEKYILTEKLILDILAIPLEQNYSKISNDIEKFAQEFLKKLFKNIDINKPEFEINYYQ